MVSESELSRFENKTQKTSHLLPQIKKNTTDDITFLHTKLSHGLLLSHYKFQLLLISVTYSHDFVVPIKHLKIIRNRSLLSLLGILNKQNELRILRTPVRVNLSSDVFVSPKLLINYTLFLILSQLARARLDRSDKVRTENPTVYVCFLIVAILNKFSHI